MNFKDLVDTDDLCEGLNMDDVSLKNGEIFGCPQGSTRYQFEDGRMECLSMEKNLSVTESNGPIESALEVLSFLDLIALSIESSLIIISTFFASIHLSILKYSWRFNM